MINAINTVFYFCLNIYNKVRINSQKLSWKTGANKDRFSFIYILQFLKTQLFKWNSEKYQKKKSIKEWISWKLKIDLDVFLRYDSVTNHAY